MHTSSSRRAGRGRLFLVAALTLGVLLPAGLLGYSLLEPALPLLPSPEVAAATRSAPVVPLEPLEPAPLLVQGRVVDAERGAPLAGASVWSGPVEAVTDAEGRFAIVATDAQAALLIKAPGHERQRVPASLVEPTIRLRAHVVKAAYLTYFGVGDQRIRSRVLDLVGRTELNAVVIDVKGDRGFIPYRTEVPLARAAGAQGPVIVRDFDTLLAELKAQGIYTIARVVVFKDNVLATHRPDLAVLDATTGKPWMDRERLAWVDPFREEVWDYVIAVAREAAQKGFDEVQFDYVRFPTDGKLSAARFLRPSTQAARIETITGFLARARRELGPTGVFLAADIFGYTAFNQNDTDIGQRVEDLAAHVDYLSPMVYPSGYHRGIPGFRNPVEHPYEIVRESVRLTRQRSAHAAARVRPWLQDFRDYAFDRRPFGPREIRAQIRGAMEAGAVGFMLWNARNDYTAEALEPARVARAPR